MKGQMFSIDAIFGIIMMLLILGAIATVTLQNNTHFENINKVMREIHDQTIMNIYEGQYKGSQAGGNVYCQDYYKTEGVRVDPYVLCKNW